jgi:ADP-ribose pyrophosphatase YjhB (NUDIX family)
MYKVFIQEFELRMVSAASPKAKKEGVLKYSDRLPDWPVLKKILFAKKDKCLTISCKNKKVCWQNFKRRFKLIEAAGGLVENGKGDILMIYRLGKWDLPKGKMKKNEDVVQCSIREVEEECGVNGLGITGKIVTTHHVMRRNKEKCLKVSHWYRMRTEYSGALVPQCEEGIEEVKWVPREKLLEHIDESWPSVKEVFKQAGFFEKVL